MGRRIADDLIDEFVAQPVFRKLVASLIRRVENSTKQPLKICMDRLLPPIRTRPIRFALPELHTVSDALRLLSRRE
jgi:hypothetical protein